MEIQHIGFKKWKSECLVTELTAREEKTNKQTKPKKLLPVPPSYRKTGTIMHHKTGR